MSYINGFLLQILFYAAIWMYDDYVGFMICTIMAAILIALNLFARFIEFIEKSKVPSSYFKWMFISTIPPILVFLFFFIIEKGHFAWMQDI